MLTPSFFTKNALLSAVLALAVSGQTLSGLAAFAAEPGHMQTPVAQTAASQIDQPKLEIAKSLTNWMQDTLQAKKALIAVIARKGGEDVKKHDATGMAHSGVAVYDPRAKTWIIYNLLNDNKEPSNPVGAIWRTAPLDFFYGQTG